MILNFYLRKRTPVEMMRVSEVEESRKGARPRSKSGACHLFTS